MMMKRIIMRTKVTMKMGIISMIIMKIISSIR